MDHKRLILIRHAHRETEIHTADNSLSDKGKKQVKQVVQFSRNRNLEGAMYLTSPKKRCIETITPVAEDHGAKVKVETLLGEGGTTAALDSFIQYWKHEAPALVVACSHGDVIPMLVHRLTGAPISIKKAGWCELELVGRDCYVTWLVQKYD